MIETFPDLDRLRLANEQTPKRTTAIPQGRTISSTAQKVRGEFLKGPVPLDWLGPAAKLPGKAPLATALAIMFEAGRRRSSVIKLTTAILQRFGVNRKAKYRALKRLQDAGLIAVHQKPRRNPVVTILNGKDDALAGPRRQDGTSAAGVGSKNQQINSDGRSEIVNLCE
jgi:hypothetical protein